MRVNKSYIALWVPYLVLSYAGGTSVQYLVLSHAGWTSVQYLYRKDRGTVLGYCNTGRGKLAVQYIGTVPWLPWY